MVFFITGIFLFLLSGFFPHITEKVYSSYIYKAIGQGVSSTTGLIPFSLAEGLILSLPILILHFGFSHIREIMESDDKIDTMKRSFLNSAKVMGIIYLSFQIMWGFNYNRIEIAQMLDMDIQSPTPEELRGLCEDLIHVANGIRYQLGENEEGIVSLPYGKAGALDRAQSGFDGASTDYPYLSGRYGRPKGILLSKPMSYTGITGFFFPFTGEANINMSIPEPLFPFTVAHEMAHQRGFAREEEANFIAYITCIHHPDEYFQYAGTVSALIYSMNALARADRTGYRELIGDYSDGVVRDLKFHSEFWKLHSGPVEQASEKINDTYLKSQNQKAGVKSYGAMVDLLIGNRRKDFR